MTTIVRGSYSRWYFILSSFLFLLGCKSLSFHQELETIHLKTTHSRALDVSDSLIIVAGTKGRFTLFDRISLKIISQDSLKGAEDIRDVEILSNGHVVFLNSGDNGIIWVYDRMNHEINEVFHQDSIFLDGLSFWDENNGIAYGDPVNNDFFIITTTDGGISWQQIAPDKLPDILENEAGFAASGSGIITISDSTVYIVSGISDTSRLFRSFNRGADWDVLKTPIKSGGSYGIYSTYFWSEKQGVIIGGSYLHPKDNEEICYRTVDSGMSWAKSYNGLSGYCSSIDGTKDGDLLVVTGRSGTYYSLDKGKKWKKLLDQKYYTVKIYKNHIYLSGKDGRFAVYSYSLD